MATFSGFNFFGNVSKLQSWRHVQRDTIDKPKCEIQKAFPQLEILDPSFYNFPHAQVSSQEQLHFPFSALLLIFFLNLVHETDCEWREAAEKKKQNLTDDKLQTIAQPKGQCTICREGHIHLLLFKRNKFLIRTKTMTKKIIQILSEALKTFQICRQT